MFPPRLLEGREKRRLQEVIRKYTPNVQLRSTGLVRGTLLPDITFYGLMGLSEKRFTTLSLCVRKVNLSADSHPVCGVAFILITRRIMQANQLIRFLVEVVLCTAFLDCSNVSFALEKEACSNNRTLQFVCLATWRDARD